jgi:D-tyrosyl-tRNA(Tyr) deacylase
VRAVVQRVLRARVTVGGEPVGEIGRGLAVLVGASGGDGSADARALAAKLASLRVFSDPQGRMNLSVSEVGGSVLVISQFTLLADLSRGRRPSFVDAGPPDEAELLVDTVVSELRQLGLSCATGRFGAHMEVDLINDGPVTLVMEVTDGKVR